ncbi:MAG: MotA/TolQ/ExbB proton channel family protein [Leptonema sp. (in: Bacteria)]|nr:MotA/TolQ/ExbB proton channel family protein [Leptonema sp. (in: bacteria)]
MNSFSPAMFLEAGGPLVIFLLLCFAITIVIIIERIRYFRTIQDESNRLWNDIQSDLHQKKFDWILQKLAQPKSPAQFVVQQLLLFQSNQKLPLSSTFTEWSQFFDETAARSMSQKLPQLERFLAYLATMGSVAPFLGLLGTVFGIIRSFLNLGQASMNELNAGIAEALVATAAGLIVAIIILENELTIYIQSLKFYQFE